MKQKFTMSTSAHRFVKGIQAQNVQHSSLWLWPCYISRMSAQNMSSYHTV